MQLLPTLAAKEGNHEPPQSLVGLQTLECSGLRKNLLFGKEWLCSFDACKQRPCKPRVKCGSVRLPKLHRHDCSRNVGVASSGRFLPKRASKKIESPLACLRMSWACHPSVKETQPSHVPAHENHGRVCASLPAMSTITPLSTKGRTARKPRGAGAKAATRPTGTRAEAHVTHMHVHMFGRDVC